MKKVSENELSELTGKTRATIRRRLVNVPHEDGPHNAHLYPANAALEAIYGSASGAEGEDGEFINKAEADRRLAIAKWKQTELETEVLADKRPKIEHVNAAVELLLSNIAATIKTSPLDEDRQNDLLTALRDFPMQLAKDAE